MHKKVLKKKIVAITGGKRFTKRHALAMRGKQTTKIHW